MKKQSSSTSSIVSCSVRHVLALPFSFGCTATFQHVPHDLWRSLIMSSLSEDDLMAVRMTCLYLQEDAEVVLQQRALGRFGVADALVWGLVKHFRDTGERLMNKGEAKYVFRVPDSILLETPHIIEHHYRWHECLYQIKDLLKASLKHHGSVRKMMQVDAKRAANSAIAEKRREKNGRRSELRSVLQEYGLSWRHIDGGPHAVFRYLRRHANSFVRGGSYGLQDIRSAGRKWQTVTESLLGPMMWNEVCPDVLIRWGFLVKKKNRWTIPLDKGLRTVINYDDDDDDNNNDDGEEGKKNNADVDEEGMNMHVLDVEGIVDDDGDVWYRCDGNWIVGVVVRSLSPNPLVASLQDERQARQRRWEAVKKELNCTKLDRSVPDVWQRYVLLATEPPYKILDNDFLEAAEKKRKRRKTKE